MIPWYKSRISIFGFIAAFVILVFPPWHFYVNTASIRKSQPAPRNIIFDPPIPQKYVKYSNLSRWENDESKSTGIDFARISIELLGVSCLTVFALLIRFRTKK